MRLSFSLLAAALLLVTIISIQPSGTGNELDMEEPSRGQLFFNDEDYEYRSMWLEGYQIVNISEVRAVVEYARKYNFNVLSPLINGDHRGVFYNSTYFPKHPDVHWSFDPLMSLIREAHKYGIQVHPWWHTLFSYPILREHPEWRSQSSTGSYSWYWINPAIPAARSYVRNVTLEVVRNYPLDGIKLDTIRYGGSGYSFDDYSINKFMEEDGEDFNRWRRAQITETVDLIYTSIMEVKPWFWVGADVFSSHWGRMNGVFQEPELWSYNGIIDYVTPMIYTTNSQAYNNSISYDIDNLFCPVVGGTYIYIPGNTAHGSVPDEETGISLMLAEVTIAQDQGGWGICAFAYKFLRQYPSYGQALLEGPFSESLAPPIKEQDIPTRSNLWSFEKDHDREGWNLYDSGHFYPDGGVWSVSMEKEPKLLSPRLNITSSGINVIEISALIEEGVNCTLEIYWGQMTATMDENRMVERSVTGTGDWNLYSIHLDSNERWEGVIRYLVLVPRFEQKGNITIDMISICWMPYCIRECAYLGPFTTGGGEDLMEREFMEGEGFVMPVLGDVESGRVWKEFSMERDLLDFRFPLGRSPYTVVYSHIFVISDRDREVQIRAGSSDSIRIWINGNESLFFDGTRSVHPDQNMSSVRLEEGYNSLFIKLAAYTGDLSFFVRFTDMANETIDDLEYVVDIPKLDAPLVDIENGTWFNTRDLTMEIRPPTTEVGVDHYELSLDEGPVMVSDEPTVTLNDLSTGYHQLNLTAVDKLGFPGEKSVYRFGVDPEIPIISVPKAGSEYVTRPEITWKWHMDDEPVSGLEHFRVDIEYGPLDEPGYARMESVFTREREFTLNKRISDGFVYSCRVTAYSGSGISFDPGVSENVIVDLLEPLPPTNVSVELIDNITRSYLLRWEGASDNLGTSGMEYLVSIEDGADISRIRTGTRSYYYTRTTGSDPSFRISPVDRAGNVGDPSDPVHIDNIKPIVIIDPLPEMMTGELYTLSGGSSYDLDGSIVSYRWMLNDRLVSEEPVMRLTLEEGVYFVDLMVVDDVGGSSVESFKLELTGHTGSPEDSLRTWLVSNSFKEKVLPVINNTIPVYPEPPEEKEDNLVDLRAGSIRTGLLIILCVFLLSVLVYLGLFIRRSYISSRRDFMVDVERDDGTDELGRPADWDKVIASAGPGPSLQRPTDLPGLRPPSMDNLRQPENPLFTGTDDDIGVVGSEDDAIDDFMIIDGDIEEIDEIEEVDDWDDVEYIDEIEEFEEWDEIHETDDELFIDGDIIEEEDE